MNEFPCTIHKLQQTRRMRGQPAVARVWSVPQGEQQRKSDDGTQNFRNRRQATVYYAFSGVSKMSKIYLNICRHWHIFYFKNISKRRGLIWLCLTSPSQYETWVTVAYQYFVYAPNFIVYNNLYVITRNCVNAELPQMLKRVTTAMYSLDIVFQHKTYIIQYNVVKPITQTVIVYVVFFFSFLRLTHAMFVSKPCVTQEHITQVPLQQKH